MRASRGFTLIELLVVIAIIGLLSSVVLASLNTARVRGADAQRVSNLRSVQTALELYAVDHNGQYPPATGGNWDSQCAAWSQTSAANEVPGLVSGGYIGQLPTDSQQNVSANTCCYLYYSGDGSGYKFMLYNCPTSKMCYTPGTGNSLYDTYYGGCSVYSLNSSGSF